MFGRRPAAVFALVACAAVFAAPPSAHAQPKPAAPADAEARLRFDEGIKLAEANDHEAARLKFNQAWALLKSPAILFNLARAEQLSNHPTDAFEHYRQFARMPADPKISDAQRQRATDNVTELAKTLGQIEVEAPTGARVSIDSRAIDATYTDTIPVLPGKHVVEAIVDGKTRSVTIECPAGAITKAKLLEASPPPTTTAPPPANPSNPPKTLTEPPKEQGPGFWTTGRAVGAGVAGVGLVGLGLGVVFHLGASSAGDDAVKQRETLPEPRDSACTGTNAAANATACDKLRNLIDDQHSKETLRTAFFIGGGALLLGGVVLFLVSSPKSSDPTRGSIRVVPIVSERETGLTVLGRF